MRAAFVVALGLFASVAACAEIRRADTSPTNGAAPTDPSSDDDDSTDDATTTPTKKPSKKKDAGAGSSAGDPSDDDDSVEPEPAKPVLVEAIVAGRERLGARSSGGYRPWRGGIVAAGGNVYWAETGATPGIWFASQTCSLNSCAIFKYNEATRVSAMTASSETLYWADVNVVKSRSLTNGVVKTLTTAPEELTNLDTDGANVYWNNGQAIQRTLASGVTSKLANSNGSPYALAFAGSKIYWAGVDISGNNGMMQVVGADGTGPRGLSNFAAGFQTMRGTDKYLYYAKDNPPSVHRFTLDSGHDEVVATGALGVKDFAFDADHAYWVEPGETPEFANGKVRRVAHDSTTAEDLAVAVPNPVALAVDGNKVFVLSAGSKAAAWKDGKVLRITLP